MVIDLRLVPEGHSTIERESALSGFEDDLPPRLGPPVKCFADIDRVGGTVVVSLRFNGKFELVCARCLEGMEVPVDGTLRVVIKEEPGRHGPASDDEGGGGADFFFDAAHELLDISSAVYEEIMLSLPMMPLCSEGCGGVERGGIGKEGTELRPIDPRWEGLMRLKDAGQER